MQDNGRRADRLLEAAASSVASSVRISLRRKHLHRIADAGFRDLPPYPSAAADHDRVLVRSILASCA